MNLRRWCMPLKDALAQRRGAARVQEDLPMNAVSHPLLAILGFAAGRLGGKEVQ